MSKRTRHRQRPKPPPVDDRDHTQLELAELAVLWPRLEAALGRDAAGPSEASVSVSASIHSAAAVNLDVVQARTEIIIGTDDIAAQVERILGLDRTSRHTEAIIEAMPDWYQQLRDRQQPLAKHIADDVQRWHRVARSALRLRTLEQPIGWLCPHHRDKPAALVKDADEATLHANILDGRPTPSGHAPLTWRRAQSVHCPTCKERWSGIAEMRVLMRMITAVEQATKTASQDQPIQEEGDQ